MNCSRGSTLWVIGRIGILICFGILPLFNVFDRAKYRMESQRRVKRSEPFWSFLDEAKNAREFGDLEEAHKWLDEAEFERLKDRMK